MIEKLGRIMRLIETEFGGMHQIQAEHKEWAKKNFWEKDTYRITHGEVPLTLSAMLGIQEEVGELSHAFLKQMQGIRGTFEEHDLEMKDSIGDITIYLMDFCSRRGWDFQDIVQETWDKVKKRDWKENPETGEAGQSDDIDEMINEIEPSEVIFDQSGERNFPQPKVGIPSRQKREDQFVSHEDKRTAEQIFNDSQPRQYNPDGSEL